jgi:hypothetical protein
MDRVPGRFEAPGNARSGTHDLLAPCAGADTGQQRVLGLPDGGHQSIAPVLLHIIIHPVGSTAQGQFAQRQQVALAEEVADRPFRLIGQIDLAVPKALQQLIRREVHQNDLVGIIEDLSGTVSQTRMPVMPLTTSLRLSRCCTLTVEYTCRPQAVLPRRASAWGGGSPRH